MEGEVKMAAGGGSFHCSKVSGSTAAGEIYRCCKFFKRGSREMTGTGEHMWAGCCCCRCAGGMEFAAGGGNIKSEQRGWPFQGGFEHAKKLHKETRVAGVEMNLAVQRLLR